MVGFLLPMFSNTFQLIVIIFVTQNVIAIADHMINWCRGSAGGQLIIKLLIKVYMSPGPSEFKYFIKMTTQRSHSIIYVKSHKFQSRNLCPYQRTTHMPQQDDRRPIQNVFSVMQFHLRLYSSIEYKLGCYRLWIGAEKATYHWWPWSSIH